MVRKDEIDKFFYQVRLSTKVNKKFWHQKILKVPKVKVFILHDVVLNYCKYFGYTVICPYSVVGDTLHTFSEAANQ